MCKRLIRDVQVGRLSRRGFLETLMAGGVAVAAVDVDKLLWMPGQRAFVQTPSGIWFQKGDLITLVNVRRSFEVAWNTDEYGLFVVGEDVHSRFGHITVNAPKSLGRWPTNEVIRATDRRVIRARDVMIPSGPSAEIREAWARGRRIELVAYDAGHSR